MMQIIIGLIGLIIMVLFPVFLIAGIPFVVVFWIVASIWPSKSSEIDSLSPEANASLKAAEKALKL